MVREVFFIALQSYKHRELHHNDTMVGKEIEMGEVMELQSAWLQAHSISSLHNITLSLSKSDL